MSKANSGKITTSLKKAKAAAEMNATNGKQAAEMEGAIRDAMSPQAVALMIAYLQGATCKDKQATRGVEWFVEVLTNTVGGPDGVSSLFDEIGV
jgi:hypothetical protein